MNRRIRGPYVRWCERFSLSAIAGRAAYSIVVSCIIQYQELFEYFLLPNQLTHQAKPQVFLSTVDYQSHEFGQSLYRRLDVSWSFLFSDVLSISQNPFLRL